MKTVVQARLDDDSRIALDRLVKRLGWSPSRVVREGLRLMTACYGTSPGKRILGVGRFDSGRSDLGSNKKHLKGFGQ